MDYFKNRTPSDRPFEGEAAGGRFKFSRRISYRNSFLPQIHARIELDPLGTVVKLRMNVHPFVIIFMFFWLGGVSTFLFLPRTAGQDTLIAGGMILFGLALIVGGFYPESFKAERLVRSALDAAA